MRNAKKVNAHAHFALERNPIMMHKNQPNLKLAATLLKQ